MIFTGTAMQLADIAWCYAEAKWFPQCVDVDPQYNNAGPCPEWLVFGKPVAPSIAAAIIYDAALRALHDKTEGCVSVTKWSDDLWECLYIDYCEVSKKTTPIERRGTTAIAVVLACLARACE